MATKPQPIKQQRVQVVEADVFDRMNETRELIAQRAYEIYESRGGADGLDQDDWIKAEGELVPKLDVDFDVADNEARLTAQVPGFSAKDLEVVLGHRRAVLCGVHPNTKSLPDGNHKIKKVMRVIELPFDIDPSVSTATLQGGTLQIVLPRTRQENYPRN